MSSTINPEGDNASEPQNSSVSTHHYGPDHRPPRERDPRKISAERWLQLQRGDA